MDALLSQCRQHLPIRKTSPSRGGRACLWQLKERLCVHPRPRTGRPSHRPSIRSSRFVAMSIPRFRQWVSVRITDLPPSVKVESVPLLFPLRARAENRSGRGAESPWATVTASAMGRRKPCIPVYLQGKTGVSHRCNPAQSPMRNPCAGGRTRNKGCKPNFLPSATRRKAPCATPCAGGRTRNAIAIPIFRFRRSFPHPMGATPPAGRAPPSGQSPPPATRS